VLELRADPVMLPQYWKKTVQGEVVVKMQAFKMEKRSRHILYIVPHVYTVYLLSMTKRRSFWSRKKPVSPEWKGLIGMETRIRMNGNKCSNSPEFLI